jgi:hypothetical protein
MKDIKVDKVSFEEFLLWVETTGAKPILDFYAQDVEAG